MDFNGHFEISDEAVNDENGHEIHGNDSFYNEQERDEKINIIENYNEIHGNDSIYNEDENDCEHGKDDKNNILDVRRIENNRQVFDQEKMSNVLPNPCVSLSKIPPSYNDQIETKNSIPRLNSQRKKKISKPKKKTKKVYEKRIMPQRKRKVNENVVMRHTRQRCKLLGCEFEKSIRSTIPTLNTSISTSDLQLSYPAPLSPVLEREGSSSVWKNNPIHVRNSEYHDLNIPSNDKPNTSTYINNEDHEHSNDTDVYAPEQHIRSDNDLYGVISTPETNQQPQTVNIIADSEIEIVYEQEVKSNSKTRVELSSTNRVNDHRGSLGRMGPPSTKHTNLMNRPTTTNGIFSYLPDRYANMSVSISENASRERGAPIEIIHNPELATPRISTFKIELEEREISDALKELYNCYSSMERSLEDVRSLTDLSIHTIPLLLKKIKSFLTCLDQVYGIVVNINGPFYRNDGFYKIISRISGLTTENIDLMIGYCNQRQSDMNNVLSSLNYMVQKISGLDFNCKLP